MNHRAFCNCPEHRRSNPLINLHKMWAIGAAAILASFTLDPAGYTATLIFAVCAGAHFATRPRPE